MLRRLGRFAGFVRRICLTSKPPYVRFAAFALGRKFRLFVGSERGAARSAAWPR
jgi:hypothetical protein